MIFTVTLNPAVDRELTVPEFVYDEVLRAKEARIDCGGKGFNVSRILIGMGVENVAVGFLGGRAGELLEDGLTALGIGTRFVWVPGETRTNVSIVSQADGHYIKVNEKGPQISIEKQTELLDLIGQLASSQDWWVLSGSLPPGVAPDFYAKIVRILNAHGAKSVFDTSDSALRIGLQENPFLVKPNASEAQTLTGMPVETTAQLKAVAGTIRSMGAQNVVISMGKSGALLQTVTGTWLTHSPEVKEMNPIGAGDSMVGGLVSALSKGLSVREALGWGVASGAATASLPGTQVGDLPLIESLLPKVVYEEV